MRTAVTALVVAALSGAALADSTVWFTIPGPISSRGLQGAITNTVTTAPPMPAAPAGSLGWSFITISGQLTKNGAVNTYAAEACIEISGPGFDGNGGTVIVKPFDTGAFSGTIPVPAGAATMLPEALANPGQTCSLRFFELYADNASGADATWSNITLTLNSDFDANPTPAPFTQMIQPTAQDPDVDGDNWWVWAQESHTWDLMFPHERVVGRMRMKGFGSALTGWATNNSDSPLHKVTVTFTAPRADGTGNVSWTVTPFGAYAASSSDFDMVMSTPVPVQTGAAYPWTYTLSESGSPVPAGTRTAVLYFTAQPLTPDAPTSESLGVVRGKPVLGPAAATVVTTDDYFATPGLVKWYTFTTEAACSNATGYWLDIHTQRPAGSAIEDTELALYDIAGNRQAADDDGGSGHLSMLTFGQTSPTRPAVDPTGSPKPRNGSDGSLAAGEHYLAVAEYNAAFAPTGWYATTTGTHSGTVTVEFRTNLPALPCGPSDLGGPGGQHGADGLLNNNDFIAFIDLFFTQNPLADMGGVGGLAPGDGHFDNNDFIVFINRFFQGCV
ncbi:MAG: GC-type dockerin domain-anchored protein [Phycisphaerales bacterium]